MGFGKKIVQAIKDKGNKLDGEMSFFEHLEALRWHLIRAALAIVVISCVAFAYYDEIFAGVIMAPSKPHFWTYRMMCDMGDFLQSILPSVFNAADFCVTSIKVSLINTEMVGLFFLLFFSSLLFGFVFVFLFFFC